MQPAIRTKSTDRETIRKDLNLKKEDEVIFDQIDWTLCPRHIAIIMDGNGRWAKERNQPRTYGHKMGVDSVHRVVDACGRLPVEVVSFYAFSTENWKRSATEVSALMSLFSSSLNHYIDELEKQGVFIDYIGDLEPMGAKVKNEFDRARQRTCHNQKIRMVLAMNYSGRADLTRTVKNLAAQVLEGRLKPESIDEAMIQKNLYTGSLPEPELLIRTSGELRLSNFMLWELAYSEFYFARVHWPDFDLHQLLLAILDYQKRNRRFGTA